MWLIDLTSDSDASECCVCLSFLEKCRFICPRPRPPHLRQLLITYTWVWNAWTAVINNHKPLGILSNQSYLFLGTFLAQVNLKDTEAAANNQIMMFSLPCHDCKSAIRSNFVPSPSRGSHNNFETSASLQHAAFTDVNLRVALPATQHAWKSVLWPQDSVYKTEQYDN